MNLDSFASSVFEGIGLRQKTIQNYQSMYKNHIRPKIGSSEIQAITGIDIRDLLKSLSPQTAATTLAVCRTLFREAVSTGLVTGSPCHGIRPPKITVKPRKFLMLDELERLDLGKFHTQILFLAFHGLRWGEAVVLTQEDIKNGNVHITKSIHGPTKSAAGIRSVPLVSEFKPFPKTPKGIRRTCHANGIHIHSLRHSYAYLLKQSGVHVTTAQRLLRHSDP